MSAELIIGDVEVTLFESSEYLEGLVDFIEEGAEDGELSDTFEKWGTMTGSEILSQILKDDGARKALEDLLERIGREGSEIASQLSE